MPKIILTVGSGKTLEVTTKWLEENLFINYSLFIRGGDVNYFKVYSTIGR